MGNAKWQWGKRAGASGALVGVVLWGCSLTGGQSGNEGTSVASGVCIAGGDHWMVRGQILSIEGDRVDLEVLSVEKTPSQPSPLEVGSVLEAFWTTSIEFEKPVSGDQVLAQYHDQTRGQFLLCDALKQCWKEDCRGVPDAPDPSTYDSCQSACADTHNEECGFDPFFYMLPLSGDEIVVQTEDQQYVYSIEDILSDDCDDSAFAIPYRSDTP